MYKYTFTFMLISPLLAFTQEHSNEKKIEDHISMETDYAQEARQINGVYTYSEVMPSYPGGVNAMYQFMIECIVYPKAALDEKIEGKIFLGFIVRSTGEIENIEVLRGIGGGCEEELVNVIRMMPIWTPGTVQGKAVDTQYEGITKSVSK